MLAAWLGVEGQSIESSTRPSYWPEHDPEESPRCGLEARRGDGEPARIGLQLEGNALSHLKSNQRQLELVIPARDSPSCEVASSALIVAGSAWSEG